MYSLIACIATNTITVQEARIGNKEINAADAAGGACIIYAYGTKKKCEMRQTQERATFSITGPLNSILLMTHNR